VGYNSLTDTGVGLSSFVEPLLPNLRNHPKFREYSDLSRPSKVIDLDANEKRICDFL